MSTLLMFANVFAFILLLIGGAQWVLTVIGAVAYFIVVTVDPKSDLKKKDLHYPIFSNAILPGAALAWLVAAWLTGGL